MQPDRSLENLHPEMRIATMQLAGAIFSAVKTGRLKTQFELFEGYRSPERQADLLSRGTTKAPPFKSAHQWGLAVDFVARVNGRWAWEIPEADDWHRMRAIARECGLLTPIAWDLPHIEHPLWKRLRVV